MPYIKPEDRDSLLNRRPQTVGELNYLITTICLDYLENRESYTSYNETIGVLECAKLELYRRRVAEYEDGKIEENGDVY